LVLEEEKKEREAALVVAREASRKVVEEAVLLRERALTVEEAASKAREDAVGYFKRKQKNPQAHGYRCSLHPGVFQSIDFPQGT